MIENLEYKLILDNFRVRNHKNQFFEYKPFLVIVIRVRTLLGV